MRKSQGFTLIELMIVVAVLGIIAAIAFPNYQAHVKRTKRAEVQAYLMELSHKAASYKLVNQNLSGLQLSDLGSSAFPQTGTKNYDISLQVLKNTRGIDSSYVLDAKPATTSSQVGTGRVTLTSTGQQCWYKNNDDANIVATLDDEGNLVPATPCTAKWTDK
ncbi:prepilin-type N-terminal cleavage/methylation domain-containing protein [Acinetobacter towneri]|uniref:type IV pilin protein n=1 Tax=Acinetobacter towneri TaxID=202956 RepID=UPI002DB639E8|nr:prepilin-type N-terminal cleavage/methylation domain-containing protein [Acinetobacter towneri]MEB6565934.1 prepilin-type N-terminal cleavage/methylation domain-containing protein [Acinetobacter towneri]